MKTPEFDTIPEAQHALLRTRQGKQFVEESCDRLYACYQQCRKDGVEWPRDLDAAWAILWRHLQRDPARRRQLMGQTPPTDVEKGERAPPDGEESLHEKPDLFGDGEDPASGLSRGGPAPQAHPPPLPAPGPQAPRADDPERLPV